MNFILLSLLRFLHFCIFAFAFCGDECRGIGLYLNGVLYMTVYGDQPDPLTFKAYDNETGGETGTAYDTLGRKIDIKSARHGVFIIGREKVVAK